MGEQSGRPDSAGDRQRGQPQGGRLCSAGSRQPRRRRLASDPATVRTVGTGRPDHTQESSPGNRLGRGARRGILVRAAYVPEAGDFVWLTFDPQAGREQAGRRPALVLTPRISNAKSGLALACPITNRAKGYPFEVAVPAGHGATGVILADHVKSVDWKARRAEKLGHCTSEVIDEVRARLAPLLGY